MPAPEAGVDRHHQHVIHHVQHGFQAFDRRGRIDDHTRLRAVQLDMFQRAMQVDTGLLVNRNPARPRLNESRDKSSGISTIRWQSAGLQLLFAGRRPSRPDRKVGHKVAVHHVHMKQSCPSIQRRTNLLGQTGKIRRQY